MSLKAILATNPVYSKFMVVVGIILTSAITFTLISALAAAGVYHVGFLEMEKLLGNLSDPKAVAIMKFIQIVSSVGTFVVPALLAAYLFDSRPLVYLSFKKINLVSALLVILAMLAALPLINYLGDLNSKMSLPSFLSGIEKWMKESEDKAAEITKHFLEMHSISDLLFTMFMIALLPAIGEELIFRGIIQRIFSEWSKNIHVAVWVTAVLFSAMHMQFYGFLPRMLLGAALGYLLAWSGSLWLPIIAHFINNAAAVFFSYLFDRKIIALDPDAVGTGNENTIVLVSVILTGFLLLMVYKIEQRKELLREN
jgi:membrane protease YdiL (CAAX protease family)